MGAPYGLDVSAEGESRDGAFLAAMALLAEEDELRGGAGRKGRDEDQPKDGREESKPDAGKDEDESGGNDTSANEPTEAQLKSAYDTPEREWVLPTHLREECTLRQMAEVFDAIGAELPSSSSSPLSESLSTSEPKATSEPSPSSTLGSEFESNSSPPPLSAETNNPAALAPQLAPSQERENGKERRQEEEWRVPRTKRVLLAIVDDDSTIVYYIVHEGVVKPRQN